MANVGWNEHPPLAKAHGGRSTAAGTRAIMHRPRSLGQTRDRVTPRKETVEDKRRTVARDCRSSGLKGRLRRPARVFDLAMNAGALSPDVP